MAKGNDHITGLIRDAEDVLTKIRQEADKRPVASPLEIDLWLHLGHLLFRNVDDRKLHRFLSFHFDINLLSLYMYR